MPTTSQEAESFIPPVHFTLRYFTGGVQEESFLTIESAMYDALEKIHGNHSCPIYIRQGETIVKDYMQIMKAYRDKYERPKVNPVQKEKIA